MKRILSIDLEKMTDESLKKRKLRLEKKIKELEELFYEKVDSVIIQNILGVKIIQMNQELYL